MTTNNNSGLKIIIGILIALLALLGFFTYQNHNDSLKTEEMLLTQKLEIQEDLDAKIVELDNEIAKSTSLKDELIAARDDISSFRDSVKDLKVLKYNIIKRYKKKLASLEQLNNDLLVRSQQLEQDNYNLTVEVDSTKAEVVRRDITIDEKTQENDSLSVKNTNLSNTISEGAKLQVSNVTIHALKERRGKLKETDRASRVDALRVGFTIRKNSIAESGKRTIHIVVKDASGKTLTGVESFENTEGQNVVYSETTEVEYTNDDKQVITVIDIPEKSLEEGNYYVDVYLEGKALANTKITLK